MLLGKMQTQTAQPERQWELTDDANFAQEMGYMETYSINEWI